MQDQQNINYEEEYEKFINRNKSTVIFVVDMNKFIDIKSVPPFKISGNPQKRKKILSKEINDKLF